ncbi:MAG: hypothetical protein IKP98_00140 [Bacilli bacterium]|nr:hypothetical protein [Bacilli bacterium]
MKRKVLIILLLILGLFVFTGCGKEDPSKAVKENLEAKGYTFNNILHADMDNGAYYYIDSKDEKIIIYKYTNEDYWNEIGYRYNDSDINEKYADIKSKDNNDTDELKAQYESYEKWLKENDLTNDDILNVLDYYAKHLTD